MLWWCLEFYPQAWSYRSTSVSQMFHLFFEEKNPQSVMLIYSVFCISSKLYLKGNPQITFHPLLLPQSCWKLECLKVEPEKLCWEFCKMLLGKEKEEEWKGRDEQSYSLSWRTASLWSHRELELQTALLCQPCLWARKPSFVLPSSQPPVGNVVWYVKWNSLPKRRSLWGFSD